MSGCVSLSGKRAGVRTETCSGGRNKWPFSPADTAAAYPCGTVPNKRPASPLP